MEYDADLDAVFGVNVNGPVQPERSLILAVIELALKDLFARRSKVFQLERDRARDWLLTEEDPTNSWPFSLNWCCAMLGVHPEIIRHRVRVSLCLVDDPDIKPFHFREISS